MTSKVPGKKIIGPLERAFLQFHRDNPWVYKRLIELCLELKQNGATQYSMRTLISVLRYEWDLKTLGENVLVDGSIRRVKLNDHHSPYYARMLMRDHPTFKGFFEIRTSEADR